MLAEVAGGTQTRHGEVAAYSARLHALRAALHAAVKSALAQGLHSKAIAKCQQLFETLLTAWEEIKAAEEQKAAEEAEMFKTKTRRIQTEEVLCCAVLCCAVLCCAVPCCAVLCRAVLCRACICVVLAWKLSMWCQEEDEVSYKQHFPDHFDAFADVAELGDLPNLGDDSAAAAQATPQEGLTDAEASSSAAQQLVHGELLSDLVQLHSR